MIDKYLQQINDPNVVSALTILNRDVETLGENVSYLMRSVYNLIEDLSNLNSRLYEFDMKIDSVERTCSSLSNKLFYGDDY